MVTECVFTLHSAHLLDIVTLGLILKITKDILPVYVCPDVVSRAMQATPTRWFMCQI